MDLWGRYRFDPSAEDCFVFAFLMATAVVSASFVSRWVEDAIRESRPEGLEGQKDDYVYYALDANTRLTLITDLMGLAPYTIWKVISHDLPSWILIAAITVLVLLIPASILKLDSIKPHRLLTESWLGASKSSWFTVGLIVVNLVYFGIVSLRV